MSVAACVFCSESIDTDFNTSNIKIIKSERVDLGNNECFTQDRSRTYPFCGTCKDPDEISQILTDLNIDHEVHVE